MVRVTVWIADPAILVVGTHAVSACHASKVTESFRGTWGLGLGAGAGEVYSLLIEIKY